ncbi:MAG: hypothetical protein AAFQ08_04030, partial [Bacteroidota bacterium]
VAGAFAGAFAVARAFALAVAVTFAVARALAVAFALAGALAVAVAGAFALAVAVDLALVVTSTLAIPKGAVASSGGFFKEALGLAVALALAGAATGLATVLALTGSGEEGTYYAQEQLNARERAIVDNVATARATRARDSTTIQTLLSEAKSKHWGARYQAMGALGAVVATLPNPTPEIAEVLSRAARRDKSLSVRCKAMDALGKLGKVAAKHQCVTRYQRCLDKMLHIATQEQTLKVRCAAISELSTLLSSASRYASGLFIEHALQQMLDIVQDEQSACDLRLAALRALPILLEAMGFRRVDKVVCNQISRTLLGILEKEDLCNDPTIIRVLHSLVRIMPQYTNSIPS